MKELMELLTIVAWVLTVLGAAAWLVYLFVKRFTPPELPIHIDERLFYVADGDDDDIWAEIMEDIDRFFDDLERDKP